MKRPLALVVAALALLGCRSPTAAIDPFFSRQTVPPPGTGVVSATPPDSSYYSTSPSSPVVASPGPASRYAPPGGSFGYRTGVANRSNATGRAAAGSSAGFSPNSSAPATNDTRSRATGSSVPLGSTNPSERPPSGSGASSRRSTTPSQFQVNNNPAIRVTEPVTTVGNRRSPVPMTTSGTATRRAPQRLDGSDEATDIMDLPNARATIRSTSPRSSGGFRPVGQVRRASYEEQVATSASNGAAQRRNSSKSGSWGTTPAQARYGRGPDYQTLQGQLEYSRTENRWKLRYIPIDGDESDEYGGSVVLSGAKLPQGYESGDFVTVSGSLGSRGADGRGFAPSYRIDHIERQSDDPR